MTSKDSILKALRASRAPEHDLPSLEHGWLRYADPLAQFQSQVAGVGGRTVDVPNLQSIPSLLAQLPAFAAAQRVFSSVPGLASNVDLATIDDPHDLETVDWAILPGRFGVAENGAVWVTDEQVPQRAIYFIVQHLALVLPAQQIVHNMHEAYDRLTLGTSSLGLFISGPSKTADIEQSLVIGAHGPRSLTVFCVEDRP